MFGYDTAALNNGDVPDNAHTPDANCPGVAFNDDTVGLLISIRAACHSDHGPVIGEVVPLSPAKPRTRHRISQPSCNFPDGTAGEVITLLTWLVVTGVCADQINPEP
ncbi:hypothetical protein GCM10020216_070600 [Nonomuraea helvata]